MISDQAMSDTAECIPVDWTPEGLPCIAARVNGQSGRFILDTGAGLMLVNPGVVPPRLDQNAQTVQGLRHTGEALSLPLVGPVEVGIGHHNWRIMAGVYNVANALGNKGISGAVGLSCFATQPVTFDLGNAALWLETPASFKLRQREANSTLIEVRTPVPHGLEAFLNIHADNADPYVAQLDSGANQIFVSQSRNAKADVMQIAPTPTGPAQSFAVTAIPLIHDMVLGLPFFLANRITIDLASSTAWIKPYDDHPD